MNDSPFRTDPRSYLMMTSGIEHPTDTPQDAGNQYLRLDPRVIQVWRIAGAIAYVILMVAASIAATVAILEKPELFAFVVVLWSMMALAAGYLVWWRPARLYRSWGYRIDDKVLETRSGLLFQVSRLLPLNRLQHVDLQRGPIERLFGLSSLIFHTAGTHASRIVIPGLEAATAARLRDQLVEIGGDDAV